MTAADWPVPILDATRRTGTCSSAVHHHPRRRDRMGSQIPPDARRWPVPGPSLYAASSPTWSAL
jgi:hypothetical protein